MKHYRGSRKRYLHACGYRTVGLSWRQAGRGRGVRRGGVNLGWRSNQLFVRNVRVLNALQHGGPFRNRSVVVPDASKAYHRCVGIVNTDGDVNLQEAGLTGGGAYRRRGLQEAGLTGGGTYRRRGLQEAGLTRGGAYTAQPTPTLLHQG